MKFAFLFLILLTNRIACANGSALFIGDSHSVMAFGQTLAQRLGPMVKRYAVSATTAGDWLKTEICSGEKPCEFQYGYSTPEGDFEGQVPPNFWGLGGLLRTTSAQRVIIALGTNDANQRCSLESRAGMRPIKTLIKRIGNRECIWIGPPVYKRGPVYDKCGAAYESFVWRMKDVIRAGGCRFIDSRRILDPRTQKPIEADLDDGIHFSPELSEVWSRAVAGEMNRRPKPSSRGRSFLTAPAEGRSQNIKIVR